MKWYTAAMANPTLIYFWTRGRAELIRLILAEAGVEYVEHPVGKDLGPRDGMPTDFGELKKSGLLAFEAVPVWIEPDGFRLAQSVAIAQYLARKHGLMGKNEREAALCEQVLQSYEDARADLRKLAQTPAGDARNAWLKELEEAHLPRWLRSFERMLRGNQEGKAFLVGDALSCADLALWYLLEMLQMNGLGQLAEKHPLLTAYMGRIAARPKVTNYLQSPKRPPFLALPK